MMPGVALISMLVPLLVIHCLPTAEARSPNYVEQFGMDAAKRVLFQTEAPKDSVLSPAPEASPDPLEEKGQQEPSHEENPTELHNGDFLGGSQGESITVGHAPSPHHWPWIAVLDYIPAEETPSAEWNQFAGGMGSMQGTATSGVQGIQGTPPSDTEITFKWVVEEPSEPGEIPTNFGLPGEGTPQPSEPRGVLAPVSQDDLKEESMPGHGMSDGRMENETAPLPSMSP
ncbi:hypothetical protein BSKO_10551 [Bryopsis sp. KO-2023]|nr:hypothetical protein BSKO_10551 [Bryopsis sp. KO-2023]